MISHIAFFSGIAAIVVWYMYATGLLTVFIEPKTFPTITMSFNIVAAIMYFCYRDFPNGLYWSAAATITFSVVYLK